LPITLKKTSPIPLLCKEGDKEGAKQRGKYMSGNVEWAAALGITYGTYKGFQLGTRYLVTRPLALKGLKDAIKAKCGDAGASNYAELEKNLADQLRAPRLGWAGLRFSHSNWQIGKFQLKPDFLKGKPALLGWPRLTLFFRNYANAGWPSLSQIPKVRDLGMVQGGIYQTALNQTVGTAMDKVTHQTIYSGAWHQYNYDNNGNFTGKAVVSGEAIKCKEPPGGNASGTGSQEATAAAPAAVATPATTPVAQPAPAGEPDPTLLITRDQTPAVNMVASARNYVGLPGSLGEKLAEVRKFQAKYKLGNQISATSLARTPLPADIGTQSINNPVGTFAPVVTAGAPAAASQKASSLFQSIYYFLRGMVAAPAR
jgi:hypothetical protein